MNGRQFELFIARILNLKFNNYDSNTFVTPTSNDYGIDVINQYTEPKKFGYKTIGFQCKDIQSKAIGYSSVEEAVAGKKFYQLDYGVVITNGDFTYNARIGAKKYGITLIDRYSLRNFVVAALKRADISAVNDQLGELHLGLKMKTELKNSLDEDFKENDVSTSILDSINRANKTNEEILSH